MLPTSLPRSFCIRLIGPWAERAGGFSVELAWTRIRSQNQSPGFAFKSLQRRPAPVFLRASPWWRARTHNSAWSCGSISSGQARRRSVAHALMMSTLCRAALQLGKSCRFHSSSSSGLLRTPSKEMSSRRGTTLPVTVEATEPRVTGRDPRIDTSSSTFRAHDCVTSVSRSITDASVRLVLSGRAVPSQTRNQSEKSSSRASGDKGPR